MADISGPGGSFTSITGFNAHFSGWSASLNVTTVETTGFAEVGNRTYAPTAIVMTGSADGTGITASTPIAAGGIGATPSMSSYTGTITLQSASGNTQSFPAVVSLVAENRRHDGKLDYALNFVSSGPILQTWS